MRKDFKLTKKYIYLDSAAGTLKPKVVIKAINDFYYNYPINPHSINSPLGNKVYSKIIEARERVSKLVDCSPDEVIFTSGMTDGMNKLSRMIEEKIKKGDNIIVSSFAHSSLAVPLIELAKRKLANVIMTNDILKNIDNKTKIIALAQVNNSFNQKNDIEKIHSLAKKYNSILINDAAQAIIKEEVSLKFSDVILFSGNKIYGPTGIGCLIIKRKLLLTLNPATYGGGATATFDDKKWEPKPGINKFEAGTLNTAGIIGLSEAINFHNNNKLDTTHLQKYAFEELNKLDNIIIHSLESEPNILFSIIGVNSQDAVSYLGKRKIILRAGTHCSQYIFKKKNINDSIRISFDIYNTKKDIDKLIKEIKNGGDFIEL